jgi:hypothetical protein
MQLILAKRLCDGILEIASLGYPYAVPCMNNTTARDRRINADGRLISLYRRSQDAEVPPTEASL